MAGVLASAASVVVARPARAGIRGLIGAAEVAMMKPGAVLINVGRGGVVDDAAVAAALAAGSLAGAALDVLPQEPPDADDPLLRHPNVLLSPHAAFYSLESDEETRRRAVLGVIALAEGRRPDGVVVEGRGA